MSDSQAIAPPALPAHVQLIQICAGAWVAQAVYAAAKLHLPDHLDGNARTATELAAVTGTHAPTLHCFMRTLAALLAKARFRLRQVVPMTSVVSIVEGVPA